MAFKKHLGALCLFVSAQICTADLPCSKTSDLHYQPAEFSVDGHVTVVALVSLHESENGVCGKMKADDYKFAASLKWAVEKLNAQGTDVNGFIHGINIGLKIYDDCGLKLRAIKFVADAMLDMMSGDTSAPIAGFIGLGNEDQVKAVASLLKGTGTPIVAALAKSSRRNNTSFKPNLLWTLPSDIHEAKVMFKVARELLWSYVALVYDSDAYNEESMDYIRNLATTFGICFHFEKAMSNKTWEDAPGIIKSLMIKVRKTNENRLGVLYFGHYRKARQLLDAQDELGYEYPDAHNLLWMMPSSVGRKVSDPHMSKPLNAVTVIALEPAQVELTRFQSYFDQQIARPAQADPNTTWESWTLEFNQTHGCRETSTPLSNLQKNLPIPSKRSALQGQFKSILDALFSLAVSVKLENQNQCEGKPGVCDELREALQKNFANTLSKISLKYDSLPDETIPDVSFKERVVSFDKNGRTTLATDTPLYTLHYSKGTEFSEMGTATIDKVDLYKKVTKDGKTTDRYSSSCKGTDKKCIIEEDIVFSYIPGDVLVLGVFPIREPGEKLNCGGYSTDTAYYTAYEAFNHAILKAQTSYESKIKVGALVIDDCRSTLHNDYLMSQIFSGKRKLIHSASGDVIDVTKIVLVIGGYTSDVSIRMANLLTDLRIPQISYASTSLDLDDRIRFPYFLRVVPSDATLLSAMANTMKTLGVTYVSFIFTDNGYGRSGMQYFTSIASRYGICVADPIMISETELHVTEMNNVVRTVSHNWASAVVFIGNKLLARNLLDALKKGAEEGQFFFFTCGKWLHPSSLLADGRGEFAKGSFSIVPNATMYSVTVSSFHQHLMQVSLKNCRQCVWTKHFWQHHFQCNIERGFENSYSKTCGHDLRISEEMAEKLVEPYLPVAVIHAVTSGVRAVRSTLARVCPNQQVYPCPNYFKFVNETVKSIKNTSLDYRYGKKFKPFQSSGNGNVPFGIYNLQLRQYALEYIEAGKYKDGRLTLDTNLVTVYNKFGHPKPIDSTCQSKQMCEKCKEVQESVTQAMSCADLATNTEETINVTIFIATVTALSAFITAGFLIWCCRKYTVVRRQSRAKTTPKGGSVKQVQSAITRDHEATELTDVVGYLGTGSLRERTRITDVSSSLTGNERTFTYRGSEFGSEEHNESQILHCHRCFHRRHQRTEGLDKQHNHRRVSNRDECLSPDSNLQASLKCALYIKDLDERKTKGSIPNQLCAQCMYAHRTAGFVPSGSYGSRDSIICRRGSSYGHKDKARNTIKEPTYAAKEDKCRPTYGHLKESPLHETNASTIKTCCTSNEATLQTRADVRRPSLSKSPETPQTVPNCPTHYRQRQENLNCGINGPPYHSVTAEVNVSWTEPTSV